MKTKFVSGAIVADAALGARQIRVVANSGKTDRAGDVLVASGCDLAAYKRNNIVLADHDPTAPIGNAELRVSGDRLEALVTFAPVGMSARADQYCSLAKAGVLSAVSVGFRAIDVKPLGDGGLLYSKWELLELSLVAVPCDPDALVIERGLKSGRVLSGENAVALREAMKCLSASADAHSQAVGMLEKADKHRARAGRMAAQIAENADVDNGDYEGDDGDDSADEELAYRLERERRQRTIEVAAITSGPREPRATGAVTCSRSARAAVLAALDAFDPHASALTDEQDAYRCGGAWLVHFKNKQERERLSQSHGSAR